MISEAIVKPVDILRDKYNLLPHAVNNEADWNELARLFVQRFQQIHGMPTDSLAGPRAFEVLDATGRGGEP
jgi:murein L,D-transpeptidase YcbB/YkuD